MASVQQFTGEIILPLEHGNHLSRAEFERRYDAMPRPMKAELVEGVVHMRTSVRFKQHGQPQFHLITWLGTYGAYTKGTIGGDNTSVRLDLDNEPQPDALLLIDPEFGGQATITKDDFIENAPELVAEVSSSSVSFDLNTKMAVYRRNGVREYLVWRVLDREFDWFVLREGVFKAIAAGADGVLRSETFPGLWLDAAALIAGDMPRVLAILQMGIDSPEHAAFISE